MPVSCPKCGKSIEYGVVCPHCHLDTKMYAKTIHLSNTLYNNGLAKVRVSDLTGAMECLNKSIAFNKNHTQARNLLGLIQYELGHLGDAIKNWVISCGLEREENPAMDYIEAFQRNGRLLERLNDSVTKYNQALKDMHAKSDDMAIIKLKQSVELNPKFVDALNLLTLCYIMERDKDRAASTAERVLAIDTNNTIALGYLAEVSPNRAANAKPSLRRKFMPPAAPPEPTQDQALSPYKKVTIHERKSASFHLVGILTLVLGVLCTLAVVFVLVIPAMNRTAASQMEGLRNQLDQLELSYEYLVDEKHTELDTLNQQLEQSLFRESEIRQQMEHLNRIVQILHAFEFFRDGMHREAVDTLGTVETAGIPVDIAERAHEIRHVSFPILAERYHREGVTAYNTHDFEKARVDFERAYRYAQHIENFGLFGDLLYYKSWNFSQIGDYDQARQFFERFLEEFPNHRHVIPARNRLNAIS